MNGCKSQSMRSYKITAEITYGQLPVQKITLARDKRHTKMTEEVDASKGDGNNSLKQKKNFFNFW